MIEQPLTRRHTPSPSASVQHARSRFTVQELRNVLHQRFEIPVLVRALRLPAGCDVLETGCGRGIGLAGLARTHRVASLTGVDIDRDAVAEASRTLSAAFPSARVFEGNACDLPFDNESFDLILDFGTLYCIEPPERAMKEIARVLRTGGRLVHETRLSQLLAHPLGSQRHTLPWHLVPNLRPGRGAGLWTSRVKTGAPAS